MKLIFHSLNFKYATWTFFYTGHYVLKENIYWSVLFFVSKHPRNKARTICSFQTYLSAKMSQIAKMSDLNIYITSTNGLISIAKLVRCVHSQMLSVEFVDFSLQSSLDQCPRAVSLKWHLRCSVDLLFSLQWCVILSNFLYNSVNANPFCCSWLC